MSGFAAAKPTAAAGPRAGPPDALERSAVLAAARELLARTAELPGSRLELLEVLGEYRRMLCALAANDST